jgi:hypothetical protein
MSPNLVLLDHRVFDHRLHREDFSGVVLLDQADLVEREDYCRVPCWLHPLTHLAESTAPDNCQGLEVGRGQPASLLPHVVELLVAQLTAPLRLFLLVQVHLGHLALEVVAPAKTKEDSNELRRFERSVRTCGGTPRAPSS